MAVAHARVARFFFFCLSLLLSPVNLSWHLPDLVRYHPSRINGVLKPVQVIGRIKSLCRSDKLSQSVDIEWLREVDKGAITGDLLSS